MPNELIGLDLRGAVRRALNEDFRKRCIQPMIDAGRKAGLTDEEINLEINRALFDAFKGLHGFPDSHRP